MKAYNHNAEPRAGHMVPSLKYYRANIRTQVQISRTQKKNIKPEVAAQACKPCPGKIETRESLRLAGHPV